MAASLDPKAPEYYGGFPLCRGGAASAVAHPVAMPPPAHVVQQHARHMASMNSDWFP
eukprot:CAMPEP_0176469302 /NCGR_PEP_ID=MMETSP0127-20121128/39695_1 /TAXON_ID=938130 /ORGANISM="Platyophrya macrostoma, Strain WH" /LENGTH=56 /DNA_ID=CAMNT_0017863211 /DNA_START=37 /DNA_END=203 /DNA_ORIENTATION=+